MIDFCVINFLDFLSNQLRSSFYPLTVSRPSNPNLLQLAFRSTLNRQTERRRIIPAKLNKTNYLYDSGKLINSDNPTITRITYGIQSQHFPSKHSSDINTQMKMRDITSLIVQKLTTVCYIQHLGLQETCRKRKSNDFI